MFSCLKFERERIKRPFPLSYRRFTYFYVIVLMDSFCTVTLVTTQVFEMLSASEIRYRHLSKG